MSSPSPSCSPLYTPRPAWSYRLSTPHHHHQCHHHHHHVHLFTLLDRHGHANPLVLVLALLHALLTALHLRFGLAVLLHLLKEYYYWCTKSHWLSCLLIVFCFFFAISKSESTTIMFYRRLTSLNDHLAGLKPLYLEMFWQVWQIHTGYSRWCSKDILTNF